jgi:hypothetical protein
MAISAAPLEMQAKKPSTSLSKAKGEARRSSTRLKTSWFSHRAYIKNRNRRDDFSGPPGLWEQLPVWQQETNADIFEAIASDED